MERVIRPGQLEHWLQTHSGSHRRRGGGGLVQLTISLSPTDLPSGGVLQELSTSRTQVTMTGRANRTLVFTVLLGVLATWAHAIIVGVPRVASLDISRRFIFWESLQAREDRGYLENSIKIRVCCLDACHIDHGLSTGDLYNYHSHRYSTHNRTTDPALGLSNFPPCGSKSVQPNPQLLPPPPSLNPTNTNVELEGFPVEHKSCRERETCHGNIFSLVKYLIADKPGPNYQEMELCLGCICEATTNCNLTIGCNHQGLCGPFLISQEYWIDAGTPVIRGDSPYTQGGGSERARKNPLTRDVMIPAYHRCVIEPYCAATTVRNYMRQFKQDCNQDSLFDCDDVARIHYLGGYQCGIDISHKGYYRVFKQCLNSIRQLTRT
ncbi:unnamed protein product [Timema podura]|uniref:lysozyme n=1 Tax=Timema podura TaxID=61482 RepID=A0ABN7NTD7_TIMPD|nr:unnamed protein product [Timema podura]